MTPLAVDLAQCDRLKEHKRLLYHLTDNPDFRLDPTYKPYGAHGDRFEEPRLYVTDDPLFWDYYLFDGARQYVVEIELGPPTNPGDYFDLAELPQAALFNLSKAKVRRVIPLSEYRRKVTE